MLLVVDIENQVTETSETSDMARWSWREFLINWHICAIQGISQQWIIRDIAIWDY